MNFELKPLSIAEVAAEKCDAVLVLIADDYKPAKDGFSALIGRAIKEGDAQTKAGKSLQLYKPGMTLAGRVVLVGVGDGGAKSIRSGVASAIGSIKSDKLKRLVVAFAGVATDASIRAVVAAVADATYSLSLIHI